MNRTKTAAASAAFLTASLALTTTPAHADSITRCHAGSLAVSVTHPTAAAGTTYYRLSLRNTGPAPCTLTGYPGVSFRPSPAGPKIGLAASRNPAHPVVTVTLWPGQHASSALGVAGYQNWSPAKCEPVKAAGLRVYPPGDYGSLWVPFRAVTCSARVHVLSVAPVRS